MEKETWIGRRFGKLTVVADQGEAQSLCRCDCGNTVVLRNTLLTGGYRTSCGCARGENLKKDITGMRSGHLVALEPTQARRSGSVLWRCQCDCGKEILTEAYKITGGLIQSCGCARRANSPDLTGQRFGRLTALERLEEKRGGSYLWRCRCDCGRETIVTAKNLCGGGTKSCGCSRRGRRKRAVDIRGQRFGRLTALEPLERRLGGSVVWRCRCDCGRETEVSYNSLTQGNTKSCGCLSKENRSLVENLRYIDGTCVELLEKKGLRKNNTSGYTGVVAYRGRWRAQITFKRRTYNLGLYDNIEDAAKVRKQAEERIFGEFLDWYYENHPRKATIGNV